MQEIAETKKQLGFTLERNTIAIVSDGSAVLGLGNIGPDAAACYGRQGCPL